MRIANAFVLLFLTVCNISAQELPSDIPQIGDLPVPAFVWQLVFFLISFKEANMAEGGPSNVEQVYQTISGSFAVDLSGEVYSYTFADEDAKDYTWSKFTALDGIVVSRMTLSLTDTIYAYIADTVPYVSLGGEALMLGNPLDPDPCLAEITANVLLAFVGVNCDGDVVTFDFNDFASGWADFAVQPSSAALRISFDTFQNIYIADQEKNVKTIAIDGSAWVDVSVSAEYDCTDVSVTLEGTVWLACKDEAKGDIALQKVPGEDKYKGWNKVHTPIINGFHLASSTALNIDESTEEVVTSDIFGLNKKINKTLATFIESALGELPTDLPADPSAPAS